MLHRYDIICSSRLAWRRLLYTLLVKQMFFVFVVQTPVRLLSASWCMHGLGRTVNLCCALWTPPFALADCRWSALCSSSLQTDSSTNSVLLTIHLVFISDLISLPFPVRLGRGTKTNRPHQPTTSAIAPPCVRRDTWRLLYPRTDSSAWPQTVSSQCRRFV